MVCYFSNDNGYFTSISEFISPQSSFVLLEKLSNSISRAGDRNKWSSSIVISCF